MKNSSIWRLFWTLFSQISHAGACVAWRWVSREQFTWLLEQILAQSNYRACWIFGSTSVQILGDISILFGEYLEIYPLDLDDFQNVPRHLITLEACSLRLATALIYIWVFIKLGRHKWSKKWKFWWKNDVSQIDRESIWDGPWTFRTSKNIILDGFQAARTLKKPKKW